MKRRRSCPPVQSGSGCFAGFRFPPEVILLVVRWYLRYGLSYRDLVIPDDVRVPERLRAAVVSVRHTSNDDDKTRGLKRTEVLRVIAESHDAWGVAAQRSRAESLNAQIKNRWQDKRAPAVGKERQLLRLLFAGIAINFQAATTYDRRTGRVKGASPPPTSAAA